MSCCGNHSEPCNTSQLFTPHSHSHSNGHDHSHHDHSHAHLSNGELNQVPKEQQAEVVRVHKVIQAWVQAAVAEHNKTQANNDLLALKLPERYTSSSTGLKPFQSVLTSITALYWSATCAFLSKQNRETLSSRLAQIPSFGSEAKLFDGKEVDQDARLNAKQLEALMRVGGLLLPEVADKEVVTLWRELAEVSAGAWEIEA
ncbi:hypothetical protein T439DRAFT_327815 [Meredithblackwellia eburnea MCA 4105]